jgi:hypothetical protein
MRRFLIVAAAIALGLAAAPSVNAEVDFVKDIKPLLEDHCLKCHSGEKPKGDLRMDTRAGILKGSKNGGIVTVGKSAESRLFELVALGKDEEGRMPPEGEPLKKEQAQKIKEWIDGGLKWPEGVTMKVVVEVRPKDDPGLPISAAEKAAVEKLTKAGVLALRLAQSTNHLRVDFALRGKEVRDEELVLLKDVPNLVELNLGGTNITDSSLLHVKPLVNLTRLQLHNTKVTDAGLENLKGLSKLKSLNLYGSAVTDKGLDNLAGLKTLTNLYLYLTKATPDGAKKLKAAIPTVDVNLGQELTPPPPPPVDPKKPDPKKPEPKKDEPKKKDPTKK